jgi:hypothetical protein
VPQRKARIVGPLQVVEDERDRRAAALAMHQSHHASESRGDRIESKPAPFENLRDLSSVPVPGLGTHTEARGHEPQAEGLSQRVARRREDPNADVA